MTYSSKHSYGMPVMILIFKKKRFPNREAILHGIYFRKRRIQQNCNFFISARNKMVGKSLNLLWSITLIWCKKCSRDV